MISANYATYKNPDRLKAIKRSVDSIINQVDHVNIHWNGYKASEIPDWALSGKIVSTLSQTDLKDNGKFVALQESNEYYLTCDDKILYPTNYVKTLTRLIDKHECIVTFHGRILTKDDSYYFGRHKLLHYLQDVKIDTEIDIPGTGIMGFKTAYFNTNHIIDSEYKGMVDLVFAVEAKSMGCKIICGNHKRYWLKSLNLKGIWHKAHKEKKEDQQKELLKIYRTLT